MNSEIGGDTNAELSGENAIFKLQYTREKIGMLKKFKIFLVAITMIFSLSVTTLAVSAEENVDSKAYADSIMEQIFKVDNKLNLQNKKFNIVSLKKGELLNKTVSGINADQALQAIGTKNGLIEVTTILPYKVLSNGELVNSFNYTPKQLRNTSQVPTEFVDITITVIAYYAHYASNDGITPFYRHAGIEAYWSSSNSTTKVSNMYVIYDSRGDLHKYPECLSQSLSSTLLENDFFIRSEINKINPSKGVEYRDASNVMPIDRILHLTDFLNHGGLIYLKIGYSTNGKSYTHDRSYFIYQK